MKILDSSVIVAYYKYLDNPKLLLEWKRFKHDILIPKAVYNELMVCEVTSKRVKKDIDDVTIKIIDNIPKEQIERFNKRYPYLGEGEISVILHTLNQLKSKVCYCVLDDRKARRTAQQKKLQFTGTVGLLKKLKEKSGIDEKQYKAALDILKKSPFRIHPSVFEKL